MNDPSLLPLALRTALQAKLPDYMVPAAICVLERLPLNANGKIDRGALPAPDQRPEGLPYTALTTPTEEQLTALWQTLLKLDRVGVHDNFFELGGHSLLATRVVAHLREQLHLEVPLRLLFQAPTVRRFAVLVDLATSVQHRSKEPLEREVTYQGSI